MWHTLIVHREPFQDDQASWFCALQQQRKEQHCLHLAEKSEKKSYGKLLMTGLWQA